MFELSFLTTLNIYEDYFEGRQKITEVAQEHNSTRVKKGVTGVNGHFHDKFYGSTE